MLCKTVLAGKESNSFAIMVSFRTFFIIFVCLGIIMPQLSAQESFADKHIEVALRKIGHEILLNAKDTSSRVLPVTSQDGQYIIPFEAEFGFKPEELVQTVSTIMNDARIAYRYIVEVEQCETLAVVYSFEMDRSEYQDIVPCRSRTQPRSCYRLVLTILEQQPNMLASTGPPSTFPVYPLVAGFLFLSGIVAFVFWQKNKPLGKSRLIKLGNYIFDQQNALLIMNDEKTELSSKEVDLLSLLYSSVNETVKKETLLQEVWGDEGSYVGRTLDVFISKLRGKLQEDPSIKILNARGVGYKLVVNE